MGTHLVSHGKVYPLGQARAPGPSASQGREQHGGRESVFVLHTLNVTSFTRYLPELQACDVHYTIMQEHSMKSARVPGVVGMVAQAGGTL
eukprot:3446359-Alexandrium_andersonii.AAC.1